MQDIFGYFMVILAGFPPLSETPRIELFIKVCNTDGRKTHVFHMVLVRVQTFGKVPERIGFSHARKRSEDTDTTDVLQMVKVYQ